MVKFVFEDQEFQKDAINSVVSVFAWTPRKQNEFQMLNNSYGVLPNFDALDPETIQGNLEGIQTEKNLTKTPLSREGWHFSIEMETGTGKTYVYIRTILELAKHLRLEKIYYSVPSVAIREGVMKTFEMTREHFATFPDIERYTVHEYDSKKLQDLKDFARSDGLQILVMTTGAINKDLNTINKYIDSFSEFTESGKPVDLIAQIRPILILDEPQNMEWEQTKKGLEKLNPLFTLRYSATHRELHNPLYSLWPNEAYQQWLVKQVEVVSVVEDENGDGAEMTVISTQSKWSKITATLECFVEWKNGIPTKKSITVKSGDDLAEKTWVSVYSGWIVDNIGLADEWDNPWFVLFSNGHRLTVGSRVGGEHTELLKMQIETAVREHFKKRAFLRKNDIKPLSLFFIDAVKNYVENDGIIRATFLEVLERINKELWSPLENIEKAHDGYFSKETKKWGEVLYLDTKWDWAKDKDTYDLIMRDKERLLSMGEPVEFLFSHSALREGWDNPNVFTIATLRESASTIKMRQEIGRGMRLCINNKGVRIRTLPDGKNPNILTVVPTISYSQFVSTLQSEYKEAGYGDWPTPHNAKNKAKITRKEGYRTDPLLIALWGKVSKKSAYKVSFDSTVLSQKVKTEVDAYETAFYRKKSFHIGERARLVTMGKEVEGKMTEVGQQTVISLKRTLDNPLETLERHTGLSRKTLYTIVSELWNKQLYSRDPEKYLADIISSINRIRDSLTVETILYTTTGEQYSLDDFAKEIESYADKVLKFDENDQQKTLYDGVIYDSTVERDFALSLAGSAYVRYFLKLPDWFKIQTPVSGGETYNPDWAILASKTGKDDDMRLYFVIETKSTKDEEGRRGYENQKIQCWKAHFMAVDEDLKYYDLTSFEELKNLIIA
jgi:type III restriction enzyme